MRLMEFQTMQDIMITVLKTVNWLDYEKELATVANGSEVMRFKVSHLPKNACAGQKCYIVYNGKICSWMEIVGFHEGDFICSTIGNKWAGKFIERSGKFNKNPIDRTGFQGWRYYKEALQ